MPIATVNGTTVVKDAASESAGPTEDAIANDSNTKALKASSNIVAATKDMVISKPTGAVVHRNRHTAKAAPKS